MPRTITLFTEVVPPKYEPSTFLVSMVAHGVALGLVYLGVRQVPRVYDPFLSRPYTVRFMDSHPDESQMHKLASNGLIYPAPQTTTRVSAPGENRPASPSALQHIAQTITAPQVLIQPDVPSIPPLPPQAITLPTVALWSKENSPSQKLVPPPPHEATTADAPPSIERPNLESKLTDLKISSTAFTSTTLTTPPGTTSPLVVHGPNPTGQIPETTSKEVEQPTPAQVISISDLRIQQGMVALPLINEAQAASTAGLLALGQPLASSRSHNISSGSSHSGDKAVPNSDGQGNATAASRGVALLTAAKNDPAQPSDSTSRSKNEDSVTRISLQKNGKFGFVVVGSSVEDQYPELAGLWNGRMAYTVYLHVGLAKNWTLQYSLPRSADAASAGEANHLEAPWPYEMVRPNLSSSEVNSDAVMVRGLVNKDGRFEEMAVIFPPQFAQTKFVLSALQDWHFRPALLNGQVTPVEVLLIIPGELE